MHAYLLTSIVRSRL